MSDNDKQPTGIVGNAEQQARQRRRFLQMLSASFSTVYLSSCGGGGDAEASQARATVAADTAPPAPVPAPPAPVPAPPAPSPTGARQVVLSAPSTATAPFTVGFAFRQGDIPAAQFVATNLANAQVSVKNRWPDGSVKYAIVAGRAALTAGIPATVALSATNVAPSGVPLSTADLRNTGVAASVGCGNFGTVSWSGADWDAPFLPWVSGPEMSSWIYRKAVGTDAHLVAWLEVRCYAGGQVEVLPWIENGYIRVAGSTSKSATFTFTLGGTQRFSALIDLPAHTRTPLVSGATLTHWLGTDPAVTPKHDALYLQSTRLVPSYRANVAVTAAVVRDLAATYTPLQLGNFTTPMGNGGYQAAIGLLPEWDVLYLTTTAAAAYGGVVRNGYSAGRWGIYYRNENTNRPLRFSQFPNLSLNASSNNDHPVGATGTQPQSWDVPHHPSVGFMAYLVTGNWFHMETVQFAATLNYLANVDHGPFGGRSDAAGIFMSNAGANTVRGAAWALRTLAQAATVTPDDDTALRNEFVASLEANVNYYHARYVAQANHPFGIVNPYGDAYGTANDGMVTEAAWQQDFFTAATGYALAADPPIGAAVKTKLQAFFAWKAKSVIGRFGGTAATDWLYRDAAPYTFVVALVDSPDFDTGTGPWPASWGAMYDATNPSAPFGPRVDGPLRNGNFPEASSYWANMQPALAYAVEHGVAGASAAYDRMSSASNWSSLSNAFNDTPVWSVQPWR